MFTGIIGTLGRVAHKTNNGLAIRAKIRKPKLGASIAVNGCCLTVTRTSSGLHRFDVGPDTWARTNLGDLALGSAVNIEPALRLGSEVSGHFVTGHVDAAARVLSLTPWSEGFMRLRIELPWTLKGLIAVKGSVAIDGVSLTVTSVTDVFFEIMLVPHTLMLTTLGRRKTGERVNVEADPLARYAAAAVAAHRRKS